MTRPHPCWYPPPHAHPHHPTPLTLTMQNQFDDAPAVWFALHHHHAHTHRLPWCSGSSPLNKDSPPHPPHAHYPPHWDLARQMCHCLRHTPTHWRYMLNGIHTGLRQSHQCSLHCGYPHRYSPINLTTHRYSPPRDSQNSLPCHSPGHHPNSTPHHTHHYWSGRSHLPSDHRLTSPLALGSLAPTPTDLVLLHRSSAIRDETWTMSLTHHALLLPHSIAAPRYPDSFPTSPALPLHHSVITSPNLTVPDDVPPDGTHNNPTHLLLVNTHHPLLHSMRYNQGGGCFVL